MTASVEAYPCGPAHDHSDRPYWEGLREGRLQLPQCAACRTWRPPGTVVCASCWTFEATWVPVAMTGHVHTWIRTHRDFMSEIDVRAPYVTAVVEVDDAPVRLLGLVTGATGRIRIGAQLTGRLEQPANADWPLLRWEVTP
jgi:uncharacterized protein